MVSQKGRPEDGVVRGPLEGRIDAADLRLGVRPADDLHPDREPAREADRQREGRMPRDVEGQGAHGRPDGTLVLEGGDRRRGREGTDGHQGVVPREDRGVNGVPQPRRGTQRPGEVELRQTQPSCEAAKGAAAIVPAALAQEAAVDLQGFRMEDHRAHGFHELVSGQRDFRDARAEKAELRNGVVHGS